MKLLPLLLIPIILLSSCSIDWNDEKDDYFTKNQECYKYKDKLLTDLGGTISASSFNIFYSKKLESCIHSYSALVGSDENIAIINTLTNETVLFCDNKNRPLSMCITKIKELKGE